MLNTLAFLHDFKGDFPDLATNEAKAKGLIRAREILRIMNRKLSAQVQMASNSISKSIKNLNAKQFDIFGRFMLLNDIYTLLTTEKKKLEEKEEKAKAKEKIIKLELNIKIPFGFTQQSLVAEFTKLETIVRQDPKLREAFNAEYNENERIRKELANLAEKLGMTRLKEKFERYNFYMLDYSKLHRNSSDMSINASYIQEAGTRRMEYLQDLIRLQALGELRDIYDKKQELINEYGEDEWQEHIPEGYKIFNPLRGDFLKTDKKLSERYLNIAIDTFSKKAGFSEEVKNEILNKVSDNKQSHLMVLPTELVDTLQHGNIQHYSN